MSSMCGIVYTVRGEVVLVIGRKESPTQRDWVEHNCKVHFVYNFC